MIHNKDCGCNLEKGILCSSCREIASTLDQGSNDIWTVRVKESSLEVPEIIDATSAGCNFVIVSWNDSHDDIFNIYWSTNPNVTKDTGVKISNVKDPYTHRHLIIGQKYYYVITAENELGEESAESYEVDATPGEKRGVSFLSRKAYDEPSTEKNKITTEEFFNKLIDFIDDPEVNKDDVRMILKNQFKFIKENKKK